jgi:hypothetical protein
MSEIEAHACRDGAGSLAQVQHAIENLSRRLTDVSGLVARSVQNARDGTRVIRTVAQCSALTDPIEAACGPKATPLFSTASQRLNDVMREMTDSMWQQAVAVRELALELGNVNELVKVAVSWPGETTGPAEEPSRSRRILPFRGAVGPSSSPPQSDCMRAHEPHALRESGGESGD